MKRVLTAMAALIVMGAALWFTFGQKPAAVPAADSAPLATDAPGAAPPPITAKASDQLIIGSVNAPLTIIEYGDFQCPICKNFFEKTEPQLRKDYIDTGKVKIEFRVETHIGAESAVAGEAAWCANDQSKFPAYHDELYKRQKGANSGAFSAANLKQIASDIGLDRAKFDGCLDGGAYKQRVIDGHNESKTRISSTPTFFIGDQKVVGAQPYSVLKSVIDSKL